MKDIVYIAAPYSYGPYRTYNEYEWKIARA